MEDVAQAAGVSRSLVSIAFRGVEGVSDSTRDRIFEAAKKLNYRPDYAARSLAQRTRSTIGVVFDLRSLYHDELIEQLYLHADTSGFELLLAARRHQGTLGGLASLEAHRCSGYVVLGPITEPEYGQLGEILRTTPSHVIGQDVGDMRVGFSRTDDSEGITLLMDHILGLGHRRIAFVSGGENRAMKERENTYIDVMSRSGLSELVDLVPGGETEAAGERSARLLLERAELPTALLGANDRSAIGIIDQLARSGVSVPHDVSVSGFDGIDIARISSLDLTTVEQDVEDLASSAMASILARIKDPTVEPAARVSKARLRVGHTTAACGRHESGKL